MFGERQRRFLVWGLCFLFTIVQCGYAAGSIEKKKIHPGVTYIRPGGSAAIEREPQWPRPRPWTARVWQVRIGHAVAPLVRMESGKVARIG